MFFVAIVLARATLCPDPFSLSIATTAAHLRLARADSIEASQLTR